MNRYHFCWLFLVLERVKNVVINEILQHVKVKQSHFVFWFVFLGSILHVAKQKTMHLAFPFHTI